MNLKESKQQRVEKDFVEQIKTAFGSNLRSVIMYGSILTENYNPLSSDINLLIILNEADPERIVVLGKYGAKTIRECNITTTIMSCNELISSADIFPMEYLDIRDLHKTLYGEDVFQDLTIPDSYLRHQIEDRLRGCINSLRQILLLSESNPKYIANGIRHTHGLYNAIFRTILRLLKSDKLSYNYLENLDAASKHIGFNPKPFRDICRITKETPVENLVTDLVLQLVDIVNFVDKLKTE